jgi:formamidopyrimidine-DNA glycosylase
MPELPEVENCRRYLIRAGMPGRTITHASIGWAKTVKQPSLDDFVLGVRGRQVSGVQRRGKYLLLPLDGEGFRSPETLILHLGMTGGLRLQLQSQPVPDMVRHTFSLDDGRELRFIDPRKFGHLWLVAEPDQVLRRLGAEPLDASFTPVELARVLGGRNAPIKALLLEQSVVAGMGNLYADESLYLAGLHPLCPAKDLTDGQVSKLRDGIVAALTSAMAQYDQSRLDYWPDPPMGLSTWTIPRILGEPCPRCGTPVANIQVRARSTYYCPSCQPPASLSRS